MAGFVAVRQAPETAKGFVFHTLEDRYGLMNIITKPHLVAATGMPSSTRARSSSTATSNVRSARSTSSPSAWNRYCWMEVPYFVVQLITGSCGAWIIAIAASHNP